VLYTNVLQQKEHSELISLIKQCYEFYCDGNIKSFVARKYGVLLKSRADSVIIIDEIQEDIALYNEIRMLVRYLNTAVIVTGSYLGVLYNTKERVFFAAGDLHEVTMMPLSFKEVRRCFPNKSDEEVYRLYRKYGGFPEVVKNYEKGDSVIKPILSKIWGTFYRECDRYMPKEDHELLPRIILLVLSEMLCEKRGKMLANYEAIARKIELEYAVHITKTMVAKAYDWLIKCGVLLDCALCPVGDFTGYNYCRYYLVDCGLLNYFLTYVSTKDESNKEGLITENYAFIELRHRGINVRTATYNQYELDFLYDSHLPDVDIIGVEVKTKDGEAKSLKEFRRAGKIQKAYKICEVTGDGNILLWEIYKSKLLVLNPAAKLPWGVRVF
jgi:predicted AAA+ superfamily ATPase